MTQTTYKNNLFKEAVAVLAGRNFWHRVRYIYLFNGAGRKSFWGYSLALSCLIFQNFLL